MEVLGMDQVVLGGRCDEDVCGLGKGKCHRMHK